MTRHRTRSLLALCLALVAAPSAGQEPAPPAAAPAPPAEAPAPVTPVPLPRVAEESEAAVQSARRLGELGAPVPEIEQIQTMLPEQAAHLAERERRTKSLAADPTSLVALEEELKGWELAREQLAGSLGLLTTRLTDLETALDELSQQREVWKATEQAAVAAVAPDTVVERIRDVRETLKQAKRGVEQRRDALLSLQNQVAEEEKRAAAALEALSEARNTFRSSMLLRDSRPWWTAAVTDRKEVAPDLVETLGVRWRALERFVAVRRESLLRHFAILAGALAATLALRRRAAGWAPDDPRVQASAVVYERPVSAALVFAVALIPVLHPRAPRLVDALGVLLLVIPLVRLLPRLLDRALAPAVYALSVFAIVDRVRDVVEKSVFTERSLLLLQTLAAFAFLAWMLRPARLAALPAGTALPRWLGWLLRTALAALGASTAANLLGWVNLARLLADGVLGSAYLAGVLYGGVRVVRTAVGALLRSDGAQRLGVVRRHGADVRVWVRRLLHTAAFGVWGWFTLFTFGLSDWVRERVAAVLGAEAQFGPIGVSLGDVLAFVLTLVLAFVISRALRTLLEDDVVPRLPAGRGVGYALTTTVHYAVLLLGFLLAISAAGVDLNKVSLLAGAFGVGIGFGLQNVVNNFVSGLILLYERPVQIGDTVEVGPHTGEVRRIGIRSSTIRTLQGAEVIVPNSNLIAERVVNLTFSDRRRRMDVKVGVPYGAEPERVLAALDGVARAHPDVLTDPEPQALFVGFGPTTLDFELRAWTGLQDPSGVHSQLGVAVARALGEAGFDPRLRPPAPPPSGAGARPDGA